MKAATLHLSFIVHLTESIGWIYRNRLIVIGTVFINGLFRGWAMGVSSQNLSQPIFLLSSDFNSDQILTQAAQILTEIKF